MIEKQQNLQIATNKYFTHLFIQPNKEAFLLLLFALAMAFSTGIKGAFDYSVFAAFALSTIKEKYLEPDAVFK